MDEPILQRITIFIFIHRFSRKCGKEDDVKGQDDMRLRQLGSTQNKPTTKKWHWCSAQIFTQRWFGGMRAHFRFPAGGINVPLTRYETSRRSGSVARVDVNIEMPRPSLFSSSPSLPPFRPKPPPGIAALYICLLHSKLETSSHRSRKQESERRWRVEGSRVTSILTLAKAKFDLLLIIRTATLKKFYRPAALFADDARI